MAEGLITKPGYVDAFVSTLRESMPDAAIDEERVRGERFRFVVVDATFNGIGHPERQRLVWDLAERTLSPADLRNISMIITMAPDEVG